MNNKKIMRLIKGGSIVTLLVSGIIAQNVLCSCTKTTDEFTWANPLKYDEAENVEHVRDPFILKEGDVWYMTGTLPPYGMEAEQEKRIKGVALYKSKNLLDWEFVDYIIETPDESEGKWYSERFWAPELFAHNGKYYVTVNCCKLDGSDHGFLFAEADNIEGPYTLMNPDKPLVLANDAHIFVDDDGQLYIFGSGIWMAKLDLENLRLLSPMKTIISPIPNSTAWNGLRPDVGFEGPYVLKNEGRYYCFYSTWTRGYEIGIAVADDINGPWEMYEKPIYGAMSEEWCNLYLGFYEEDYYLNQDKYRLCGHNSVFEGPDGGMWLAAHVNGGGVVEGVQMTIDRIMFDEEYGILAMDPATGKGILGPSYGKQTIKFKLKDAEPDVVKALDVWCYTSVGEEYVLTEYVDVLMENGFRRTASVVWEKGVDTSAAGKVTINGVATFNGMEYPVKAIVEIED